MTDEHTKLRRIEGDLELVTARVDGLRDNLLTMSDGLLEVIQRVSQLAEITGEMRAKAMTAETKAPRNKVWLAPMPPEGSRAGTGSQLLIEEYPDGRLVVAFRSHSGDTWSVPVTAQAQA